MLRKDVYKLIDEEREYQNKRNSMEHDKAVPVEAWVLYMKYQIKKAEKALYCIDHKAALERVRKATALGVVCMEYNETQPRV